MADRSVRNLSHLQQTASTARVLNLHAITGRYGKTSAYREKPMFQHAMLNRGIYVKHRLRPNEVDLFDDARGVATKVLLPLDPADLRAGGRYVFVGERNFDRVLANVFGPSVGADRRDRQLLDLLDSIPSLDPFVMREHLRRHGFDPAPCYFDLSEADLQNIFAFVREQVDPLIRLAISGRSEFAGEAGKLAGKLLSGAIDDDLDPLRRVLRLEAAQFAEGVFCWKGFLYYKWELNQVMAKVPGVLRAILATKPYGRMDAQTRSFLETSRTTIRDGILAACEAAKQILDVYDIAFADLTDHGEPIAFRDFLLAAPNRFIELGERLGAINHLLSFWSFRFPENRMPHVSPEELSDIFLDFEQGLSFRRPELLMIR